MPHASVILRNQSIPDFREQYIAGVDEAGRGALAGPVVAAAVILDPQSPIEGCVDSKKLSAPRRAYLADKIKAHALAWAIGSADNAEIDRFNILNATLLAMERAVAGLPIRVQRVLVDGNRYPKNLGCELECRHAIVGGDERVTCIAAASILAKTTRDRQMCQLAKQYPAYHFAQHKGYATRRHVAALAEHGSCAVHRVSWDKVQRLTAQTSLTLEGGGSTAPRGA